MPGVSTETALAAIGRSVATWNGAECASLAIAVSRSRAGAASNDGRNTIAFRTDAWTTVGFPADTPAYADVHYAELEPGRWWIVEADIYLNGVDFEWTDDDSDADPSRLKISTVVAHEIGHALGILHPCETEAEPGVPSCELDPSAEQSLLFPEYDPSRAPSLGTDDRDAVCSLYPRDSCVPACRSGMTCVDHACVATCGVHVCAGNESCVAEMCFADCVGLECISEGPCARQDDCDPALVCHAGFCLAEGGQIGDPCEGDSECVAARCLRGFCRSTCDVGVCPGGSACEPIDGALACLPFGSDFGTSCGVGAECVSGICLRDADRSRMCTRTCGGDVELPCPTGFGCDLVDGRAVCVPHRRAATTCAAAPHGGGCTGLARVLGVLAGALLLRKRRR